MTAAAEPRMRWCPACHSAYRADFARCPIDGGLLVETDDDPLLGQTIGQHYVIDTFIGEGAMARVYRAHHALLEHKQFAVKVMIGDLAATLEMRLRFAQEADAASQLDHPNVVSVVDFGKTDGGLMFIAMEFIEGRSLATLIDQDAPLAPARALALARQICLGLGHAHERGLVHRDLKPENVIISFAPEVARIVDFGLAIPVDDERSTRLTNVGLAVGTPIYAAPEQTHNEPVDHRADLFALGVTLYEMLAGVTPFQGALAELIRQNASDQMTPIAARSGVNVQPAIEAVVKKLMRRDPAHRFASAAEVVAAIDLAVAAPAKVITLPVLPPRRSRAWIVAAVLAVALVVVGYIALSDDAPPPLAAPPPVIAERAVVPDAAIESPPVVALPPVIEPPDAGVAPRDAAIEPVRPPRTPVIAPALASPVDAAPAPVDAAPEPAVVVTPPVDAAPPPVVVTPPEQPPRVTVPTIEAAPLWTTATPAIAGLNVRGSLSDADVRRAIERGFAPMKACYQQAARAAKRSPAATVRVTLSFDDTRQASSVAAISPGWPELAICVRSAAEQLRVQTAPDVGSVAVVVDIAFKPVAP